MSISALYILDLLGKPLIYRCYRENPDPGAAEKFVLYLCEKEEEKQVTPVFEVGKNTFAFLRHNNLYFVATISGNANITIVFMFLHKLLQVMSAYFNKVEEESIRDNFVILYELLDETMDFGYPQSTESRVLLEYITQTGEKLDDKRTVPPAVTSAVSWRPEGIKYKKNELFVDVIETVDLLANASGIVIRSEITGCIKIKTRLSGMPELSLGLNDKLLQENGPEDKSVDLDEVKFHQCVRLGRFNSDRSILFIPPDGEFDLMTYRLSSFVKPPLWVDCVREFYPSSKVEYRVKIMTQYKSRYTAKNVEIRIPVPTDVDSPTFKTASGVVIYLPEDNVIKWSFKSLSGGKELFMSAKFGLPSVSGEQEPVPPVQARFDIGFYSISGMKVQYMKVTEKSGYLAIPWIRYFTQNGDYQIRHKEVLHGNRGVVANKTKRKGNKYQR